MFLKFLIKWDQRHYHLNDFNGHQCPVGDGKSMQSSSVTKYVSKILLCAAKFSNNANLLDSVEHCCVTQE